MIASSEFKIAKNSKVKKLVVILPTPIGEIECLSNLYLLLYCLPNHPVFSFTPFFPIESVRPPLVTYPPLCSTCVTYRTPCHTSGQLVLYCNCYGFDNVFLILRCFLPCTPSCFFQGFPGTGSSTSKSAWLHADLLNIAPTRLFV